MAGAWGRLTGPITLGCLWKEEGEGKRGRGAWLVPGVSQGKNKGPATVATRENPSARHPQLCDTAPGCPPGTLSKTELMTSLPSSCGSISWAVPGSLPHLFPLLTPTSNLATSPVYSSQHNSDLSSSLSPHRLARIPPSSPTYLSISMFVSHQASFQCSLTQLPNPNRSLSLSYLKSFHGSPLPEAPHCRAWLSGPSQSAAPSSLASAEPGRAQGLAHGLWNLPACLCLFLLTVKLGLSFLICRMGTLK